MAEKVAKGERLVVKSMDQVDFSNGQPAEIEVDNPVDGDTSELVYEGGPLDGQRGTEVLEDPELAKKIEERRAAEQPPKEGAEAKPEGEDQLPTGKDEEGLPEVHVGDKGGEAKGEPAPTDAPAFEPNLTYKVYGEEKTFPDWAKPLVKDAETEASMRSTFERAEALDRMKEIHQNVVRERDQSVGAVTEQTQKVARLVELRKTNPAQFFHELGVTDDMLLAHTRRRLEAMEKPESEAAYQDLRRREIAYYENESAAIPRRIEEQSNFISAHRVAYEQTLSQPDVKSYEEGFDAKHGAGAFRRQCDTYGSSVHQQQRGRYAPPTECVQAVMQHYGAVTVQPKPAPVAPVGDVAPASKAPGVRTPDGSPARPKVVPRVGPGSNVSPTRQRLRTLDEVKKKVDQELSS